MKIFNRPLNTGILGVAIAALKKKYGSDKLVDIRFKASERAPKIILAKSENNMDVVGEIDIIVRGSGVALGISTNIYLATKIEVVEWALKGEFLNFKLNDMKVTHSNIGDVEVSGVETGFDLVIGAALGVVNGMLGDQGFPLPQLSPMVSMQDSNAATFDGFIKVGATPIYIEKSNNPSTEQEARENSDEVPENRINFRPNESFKDPERLQKFLQQS
jgi:hypothetical protein